MLSKRGYTALEDLQREEVQGVYNNGEYALVMPRKLTEARVWLETKDYYKNWDADYKELHRVDDRNM